MSRGSGRGRRKEPAGSRLPADTRYYRAHQAFEQELANPNHTVRTLIGSIGKTLQPPLGFSVDAVEGIEYLMWAGASKAVIVYAIVREFDAFQPPANVEASAETDAEDTDRRSGPSSPDS